MSKAPTPLSDRFAEKVAMCDCDAPPLDSAVLLMAEIVSNYVGSNSLPAGELPKLIVDVHSTIVGLYVGAVAEPVAEPLTPAVPVKKSITPDHIVCLEDGRKLKSLKRHLRARYDLTPDQYRAKWGLPDTYPMVAPNYAAARSALAKNMGLGQVRRPIAA